MIWPKRNENRREKEITIRLNFELTIFYRTKNLNLSHFNLTKTTL